MITDWIGWHDVLLPINQNYDKSREMNKASTEHLPILKRRYECWKTQQFTQQSATEQRAQLESARKMACTVQLQAWRVQLSS